jgi:hypothetical protein
MPSWLVDDPFVVYLLLAIVALCLGAAWWRSRQRQWLYGLAIIAGLFVIVMLLAHFVETDEKRIKRSLNEMVDAANRREVARLFENISDQFRIKSVDKATFRNAVRGLLERGEVTHIKVWDIDAVEISRPKRAATVDFFASAKGPWLEGSFYRCRSRFVLDADNKWRLQTFELFQPQIDPNSGQSLPLPLH